MLYDTITIASGMLDYISELPILYAFWQIFKHNSGLWVIKPGINSSSAKIKFKKRFSHCMLCNIIFENVVFVVFVLSIIWHGKDFFIEQVSLWIKGQYLMMFE